MAEPKANEWIERSWNVLSFTKIVAASFYPQSPKNYSCFTGPKCFVIQQMAWRIQYLPIFYFKVKRILVKAKATISMSFLNEFTKTIVAESL